MIDNGYWSAPLVSDIHVIVVGIERNSCRQGLYSCISNKLILSEIDTYIYAGIAFNPYNDYMYVTNEGSGSVSVINQSNVVINNISVQTSPYDIAFDPYNDYM